MSRRNKTKINDAVASTEKTESATADKQIPTASTVLDAFSNTTFNLGFGSQAPTEATQYPLTRLTQNFALMNSLYRTNWVVQNVVGIIPDDMTREWFKLNGNIGPEHQAVFKKAQTRTKLREKINDGLRWGRLYGGAVGLILIRGHENMLDTPLDLNMILPNSFSGLYILDRWVGVYPELGLVSDMSSPDFGMPEFYNIAGPEMNIVAKVHHTRIVRFTGRELPEIEKIAEMYWGESEVEALYSDLVNHDNTAANMAALTFRANVDTMEVQNLDQILSIAPVEQQRKFWNTMQAQNILRSNYGTRVINKGDAVHNTQYTFTGLSDVFDSMCMQISGASRIPVTKLFGRSPGGLNATGEGDLQNYYDYIATLQESKLKGVLEKLVPIIAMSEWGQVPDDLDITFPPLWTPTAKEVGDITKAKAEAIVKVFQAGLMGVDTTQKELKKLADETGMFDSISDEEIKRNEGKTFQDVTALRDPLSGLGFGADNLGEEMELNDV